MKLSAGVMALKINVINDWVYIQGDGFPMFKIRTDGSGFQEV